MGVIVTEEYTLGSGITINSYYASINTNDIRVTKDVREYPNYDTETGEHTSTTTTKYRVEGTLTYWISLEAKEAGKSQIGMTRVSKESDTPITDNVYTMLYDKFKESHTNTTDVFEA